MKKIWMMFVMLGVISLAACNTIEGAGKDIEKGGDTISDTAKDAKN